jgi:MtN3 and saliva related transmembrane protein
MHELLLTPTIVSYVAAVLSAIAYIPQALKIISSRDVKAISLSMYGLMIAGISCWLVYGVMVSVPAIILSNVITLVLLCTIFGMKLAYR